MIKQVLLLKFKPQISDDDKKSFFENYQKLVATTPLEKLETGQNISSEELDKGFTHVAIAYFPDQGVVEEYLNHPIHNEFAKNYFNPMLEDFIIVEIKV